MGLSKLVAIRNYVANGYNSLMTNQRVNSAFYWMDHHPLATRLGMRAGMIAAKAMAGFLTLDMLAQHAAAAKTEIIEGRLDNWDWDHHWGSLHTEIDEAHGGVCTNHGLSGVQAEGDDGLNSNTDVDAMLDTYHPGDYVRAEVIGRDNTIIDLKKINPVPIDESACNTPRQQNDTYAKAVVGALAAAGTLAFCYFRYRGWKRKN